MFKILYLFQTFVIQYDFTSLLGLVSTPKLILKLVCAIYFVFKKCYLPLNWSTHVSKEEEERQKEKE
jgi:hypothetical protein